MGLLARVVSLKGLLRGLDVSDLDADPMREYDRWYTLARRVRIYWPNSVALATADGQGRPSVRMVLLKGYGEDGITFYTNYRSQKGKELDANPWGELVIYWNDLVRQVRFSGRVSRLSREASEAYFHSRPRGSQIGAWASDQDEPVESRAVLMKRYEDYEKQFAGGEVPLPDHWGGYRLEPEWVEFWQGRAYRLHDRFRYARGSGGTGWTIQRLCP
ncbi:MAG TPA: pyridoxamine 5'-phosphate oxidase [Kiritimatiellia bacterium]|nr:pyridoxamine 5'-phosphate oxidase [Kiritimatiellia bacterium]